MHVCACMNGGGGGDMHVCTHMCACLGACMHVGGMACMHANTCVHVFGWLEPIWPLTSFPQALFSSS